MKLIKYHYHLKILFLKFKITYVKIANKKVINNSKKDFWIKILKL